MRSRSAMLGTFATACSCLVACLEGDPNPFFAGDAGPKPASTSPSGTGTDAGPAAAGSGLAFDYPNDSLSFDGRALPGANPPLTVEMWINATARGTGNLVGWGEQAPRRMFSMGLENHFLRVTDGENVIEATVDVADGAWHHVAIACSSGCDVFIDGAQQAIGQLDLSAFTANAGTRGYVGYAESLSFTSAFAIVDEVRIWKTTRSSNEIVGAMKTSVSTSDPNLVVYFQMEGVTSGAGHSVPQLAKSAFNGDGVLAGSAGTPTVVPGAGIPPAQ